MEHLDSKIKLVVYPDSRLLTKSDEVTKFDDALRNDFELMKRATEYYGGIGIAGCQIGLMKKVIYINHDHIIDVDNKAHGLEGVKIDRPLFLANAEIVEKSDDTFKSEEGCLSLPTVEADVNRASYVKVKYQDENGDDQIIESKSPLLAACLQHEIDHTNGVTIAEYQSKLKKDMIRKKLQKFLKHNSDKLVFDASN